VAVSVDPPLRSQTVVERWDLPFPILADEERVVIEALGLVHSGGGPGGSDIALPAHLLISREGEVLRKYVAERIQDRMSPAAVLAEVRAALAAEGG
jgi:peroxiredoxin